MIGSNPKLKSNKGGVRSSVIRVLSGIKPIPTAHKIGEKLVLLSQDEFDSPITQISVTILHRGEKSELHTHETMDEHFFILSGNGEMVLDNEQVKCECGMYILVPARTSHSICAFSDMKCITIGVSLD